MHFSRIQHPTENVHQTPNSLQTPKKFEQFLAQQPTQQNYSHRKQKSHFRLVHRTACHKTLDLELNQAEVCHLRHHHRPYHRPTLTCIFGKVFRHDHLHWSRWSDSSLRAGTFNGFLRLASRCVCVCMWVY